MSHLLKILLLILVIVSFNLKSYSQSWAPIGAKWHYEKQDMFSNVKGFFDFESVRDTIVYGHNCKIIKSNNSYSCLIRSGPIITYESNDSVYFLTYVDTFPRF